MVRPLILTALACLLAVSPAPPALAGPASRMFRPAKRPATSKTARTKVRRVARPAVRQRPLVRFRRAVDRQARAKVEGAFRRAKTIVLDLDNTVVDTRHRTVAAVQQFARDYTGPLKPAVRARLLAVTTDQVGYDADETAIRLGLGKDAAAAFSPVWKAVFWNPASLELDRPIPETLSLIAAAQAQGKNIVYLTGRTTKYTEATVAQLDRLGLAVKPGQLRLKLVGQNTAAFKAKVLGEIAKSTSGIVFVDDSRLNIATVQRSRLPVETVVVDFPVTENRPASVTASTMRLPLATR